MQLSRIDLKNGAGQGIAFSPDGSHLAVSTAAGGVFLYRTDHYEPERCLTPEVDPTRENWHRASITAVAVASHSGAVFTGSRDKTVKRWDLATGRVAETVVTTTKPVSCLACSGDGTILAVGTGIAEESFEPGELRIIDINTHKTKCAAADPKGAITSVSVSTDGRIVAACQTIVQAGKGQNREAFLFEPESGQVTPLEINGLPQSVAISPDSRFLAVGCANGTIVVRSLRLTEKVLEIPPIIQAHEEGVASIAISPDAKTIGTIGGDRIVRLWDAATGEELISFQSNGRLHFIRFSPDGNCLVVGGGEANRAISRVWVTETSQ
jgi:WD40 repeat protein